MVRISTITLEDKVYSLGFKVVTESLESLGLRNNPNIIKYPINEWYCLPKKQVKKGSDDYGGIWVARTLSGANALRKYMLERYSEKTRIFKAALDEVLYFNNYRIKVKGINMFEEIFFG